MDVAECYKKEAIIHLIIQEELLLLVLILLMVDVSIIVNRNILFGSLTLPSVLHLFFWIAGCLSRLSPREAPLC